MFALGYPNHAKPFAQVIGYPLVFTRRELYDNPSELHIIAHLLTSPEAAIAPGEALLASAALGGGVANTMIGAGRNAGTS